MNRFACGVMVAVSVMVLAGAPAGTAMAQSPNVSCALPAEPEGLPAALDAAISGPADKDRACMKALFTSEARLMFVSLGADGAPRSRVETVDEWIVRVKARGRTVLEEKQLKVRIEHDHNVAQLWSNYTLQSDGKEAARGINSIHAINGAGGWRIAGLLSQTDPTTAAPATDVAKETR